MRLIRFQLSGVDYTGDEAARMYEAALTHGFDRIGADFDPWPLPRSGIAPERFTVDARVSGVAACCEIAFDSETDALFWIAANPTVEPSEPAATLAYLAILAAREPQA